MKFRFKFASVEKHRRVLMDIARKEFLDAKANVDAKLNEIDAFYASIDAAREKAECIQNEKGAKAAPLVQIESFITGQNIRITRARLEVRELMAIAEEKHEQLIEKVTEHKAMVKLRERHQRDFKKKQKKLVQKESDDLTATRFRLRGVV